MQKWKTHLSEEVSPYKYTFSLLTLMWFRENVYMENRLGFTKTIYCRLLHNFLVCFNLVYQWVRPVTCIKLIIIYAYIRGHTEQSTRTHYFDFFPFFKDKKLINRTCDIRIEIEKYVRYQSSFHIFTCIPFNVLYPLNHQSLDSPLTTCLRIGPYGFH